MFFPQFGYFSILIVRVVVAPQFLQVTEVRID
jgi:hypothetical protein